MSGFLLPVLVACIIAVYNLCARLWVVDSRSPLAFSILYTSSAAILSLGILLIEPWVFADTSAFWIGALLLAGLLYGLYDATQFSARKYIEASTMSLFSQLAPVITLTLAVSILGERLSYQQIAGVICILAGNIIVLYRRGARTVPLKGVWFGLASATFVGVAYLVDKTTFDHFPMALYVVTVYLVPAVIVGSIFVLTGGTRAELTDEFKRTTWKVPALSFLGVLGFYFLLKAYELAPLSIAIPVVYSSTILTTLGGILMLHERHAIMKKMIAMSLVFAGLLLLH